MKRCRTAAVAFLLPLGTLLAQGGAPAPVITLFERQARVVPMRSGFNHTGGGNIDVARPGADAVVINMSGVAVAGAHPCRQSVAAQDFDLVQAFEVALEKPLNRKLSLVLEGRVIGLLRSHKGGGVAEESGQVSISNGKEGILVLPAPAHAVSGGDSLSINDHVGPVSIAIAPGKYTVRQTFHVAVNHPCSLVPHKASSAEFAPDPALEPVWISYFEPFHGAIKKDFGYQIAFKVVAE